MAKDQVQPTGRESPFRENEITVSKTDPRARLTYSNDVLLRISGDKAKDLIGQAHSIIRHPDMPPSIFAVGHHPGRTV